MWTDTGVGVDVYPARPSRPVGESNTQIEGGLRHQPHHGYKDIRSY